jgi:hypothetical protein
VKTVKTAKTANTANTAKTAKTAKAAEKADTGTRKAGARGSKAGKAEKAEKAEPKKMNANHAREAAAFGVNVSEVMANVMANVNTEEDEYLRVKHKDKHEVFKLDNANGSLKNLNAADKEYLQTYRKKKRETFQVWNSYLKALYKLAVQLDNLYETTGPHVKLDTKTKLIKLYDEILNDITTARENFYNASEAEKRAYAKVLVEADAKVNAEGASGVKEHAETKNMEEKVDKSGADARVHTREVKSREAREAREVREANNAHESKAIANGLTALNKEYLSTYMVKMIEKFEVWNNRIEELKNMNNQIKKLYETTGKHEKIYVKTHLKELFEELSKQINIEKNNFYSAMDEKKELPDANALKEMLLRGEGEARERRGRKQKK